MALTTSSWSRPIQGVSQQPPKVRLEGQCTTQDNASSSVINGLTKRLGTISQKRLSAGMPKGTKFYYYNRGTDEKYFIAIPPNQKPIVYDNKGSSLVVEEEHPDGSYYSVDNPENTLEITTISDYTFIANNKVVPKAGNDKSPINSKMAIINLQFADYGREYKVFIDGKLYGYYLTPNGKEADQVNYVSTSHVATMLYYGGSRNPAEGRLSPPSEIFDTLEKDVDHWGDKPLSPSDNPGLNSLTDFNVTLDENVILIERKNGGDFDIKTSDGADGGDLISIRGKVKTVGDLPRRAPGGYTVEVVGEGNSDDDNYWLEAVGSGGGEVTWGEAIAPNVSLGFDKTTMPAVLIRDRFSGGKAVFKITTAPWAERTSGDDETNPFPSFVEDGEPIQSIGTFQNRLFFTAGESVIYSRSNYFFDFFRETVRTSLDDEPIDVLTDTNQVNRLQSSTVLDGDLVLFSPNGQFIQFGKEPITKSNASLQYASSFENIADCNPVAGGDTVFFAFQYGRYSGIREFYTDSLTDTKKARPITDHVDEYILGSARLLVTSTNRSQMLVMAEEEDTLYVYEWLWQGNERAQSSWSRWIFDGWVRHVAYDRDNIYLMIEREGGLMLEYIKTGDPADPGLDFACRLDQRTTATATYNAGFWFFNVDPNIPIEELVIIQGEGCISPGVTVDLDPDDSFDSRYTRESLSDTEEEVTVIMGRRYNMVYQPTMPFIKDKGGSVIETDRLTINDINVNYNKTGLTFIYVENDYGVKRDYSFNGRDVGGINNIVGFAPIRPGQFSFPIRQESDRVTFRLETDSHVPFELRDMEWRGRFHQRGRRV